MSDQIRCFIAIALPDLLKLKLSNYTQSLKQTAPNIRWTKTENMHLTLKFLGEQPSDKLDRLIANTVTAYSDYGPFEITTESIGAFPSRNQARIIWLGIQSTPQEALTTLHNLIERILEPLDFVREPKPFRAHLTLGRSKEQKSFIPLWNFADKSPFPSFSFEVNQILLMRSILKREGPKYSILQKFPLQ